MSYTGDVPYRGMKPILILVETGEPNNVYGWKRIEILAFNIDDHGFALVRIPEYGEIDALHLIHPNDLCILLEGDPGDGTRWYKELREESESEYQPSFH